jgi:hypothetical protein
MGVYHSICKKNPSPVLIWVVLRPFNQETGDGEDEYRCWE